MFITISTTLLAVCGHHQLVVLVALVTKLETLCFGKALRPLRSDGSTQQWMTALVWSGNVGSVTGTWSIAKNMA
jgi:hypothetical protein